MKSFPRLTILRQLATGGQKAVLHARDDAHGEVVLKLYHPNTNLERALREAAAGRKLSSDSVPEIYELGTVSSDLGDVIWLTEEYVSGTGLRDLLLAGEIPTTDILRWARTLLQILEEAERLSIVHRDIKPENIRIDNDRVAWLLDFGLARHLDLESVTATEAAWGVGTPGYAPPEQFMNLKGQIDSRSDLFGLGVTLFECIEGKNPYITDARDQNEIYERVATRQLPRITPAVDTRDETAHLVLALTRREQEHRPRSVREALEWIVDICDAEDL